MGRGGRGKGEAPGRAVGAGAVAGVGYHPTAVGWRPVRKTGRHSGTELRFCSLRGFEKVFFEKKSAEFYPFPKSKDGEQQRLPTKI